MIRASRGILTVSNSLSATLEINSLTAARARLVHFKVNSKNLTKSWQRSRRSGLIFVILPICSKSCSICRTTQTGHIKMLCSILTSWTPTSCRGLRLRETGIPTYRCCSVEESAPLERMEAWAKLKCSTPLMPSAIDLSKAPISNRASKAVMRRLGQISWGTASTTRGPSRSGLPAASLFRFRQRAASSIL